MCNHCDHRFKWYELLICCIAAVIGYYGPVLILVFQTTLTVLSSNISKL